MLTVRIAESIIITLSSGWLLEYVEMSTLARDFEQVIISEREKVEERSDENVKKLMNLRTSNLLTI